jgi:glycosyltransferase involved in cell wall biosynthesis
VVNVPRRTETFTTGCQEWPVRVAIDARKLHDYGIGTYVRNLVRHLARMDRDNAYVLICRPQDVEFARALGPNFTAVADRSRSYSVREQFSVPWALRRTPVDVFHAPHYVFSPFTPCPTIVTIHDCIHLRLPQYLPNRRAHLYARTFLQLAARRAKRVLTVSHASKDDILHYLRIPASKIDVIPNALDEQFETAPSEETIARVRERFLLNAPFVLYAGNIKPHKNVDRLIEAFALLRRREFDGVKLLIIGDQISQYPNLRRLVHRHQLHQHVRFLGFVPDQTLAVLYRLASVFVFPSLYEGFGLPPLEAMASGTAVISSNVSSLPEVVGDAGLLVDPMNPQAIADAMARVLSDPELRSELIRRGHERVKAFSWERSVARIRGIYAEVARGATTHG